MTETHVCEGTVWGASGWRALRPCGRKASLQEGGKWYCRTHAPSIVEAKLAARDAKWEAEWAAKDAKRKAQEALKVATEKLAEAALNVPDPTSVSVNLRVARKNYLAAKATLESLP